MSTYIVVPKLSYVNQTDADSEYAFMMEKLDEAIADAHSQAVFKVSTNLYQFLENEFIIAHAIINVINHELSKRHKKRNRRPSKVNESTASNVPAEPCESPVHEQRKRVREQRATIVSANLEYKSARHFIRDGEEYNAEAKIMNLARQIARLMKDGNYRLIPYRLMRFLKASGGFRPIRCPEFSDKVIQRVVAAIMSKIIESNFCLRSSYAYRPRISGKMAVEDAEELIINGYHYVFCADIKNYFDEIKRELLLNDIRKIIDDQKFVSLVEEILSNPSVTSKGTRVYCKNGIPQGSAVSPTLSNLYLYYFDLYFEAFLAPEYDARLIRYSDNIWIFSKKPIPDISNIVTELMDELGLRFHDKHKAPRTVDLTTHRPLNMLGYSLHIDRLEPLHITVKPLRHVLEQMRSTLTALIDDDKMHDKSRVRHTAGAINNIVRGYRNYFSLTNSSQWIRKANHEIERTLRKHPHYALLRYRIDTWHMERENNDQDLKRYKPKA